MSCRESRPSSRTLAGCEREGRRGCAAVREHELARERERLVARARIGAKLRREALERGEASEARLL